MSKFQLLYGFHALTSRLRHHPDSIRTLYVDGERQDARLREFLAQVEAAGLHPRMVAGERLDRMAGTRRHQGVVAEVSPIHATLDLDTVVSEAGADLLILALDGIQDPHNLGACLRVADAMGVHAVVAPRDRSVALTATAAKVASGAADTVPYLPVTNLVRTLRDLQDHGVWVVGTDDQAETDLEGTDVGQPMAWVLGAEGSGLRRLTREACDQRVRIPMLGSVESLNVSVAAGICLYETRRRRLRSDASVPVDAPGKMR